MNRINSIAPGHTSKKSGPDLQQNRLDETVSKSGPSNRPWKDFAVFSYEWESAETTEGKVEQLLSYLQGLNPDMNICITDKLDKNSLPHAAALLGEGIHIIISQDFMAEMKSSPESYERCRDTLFKLLGRLSTETNSFRAQGLYIDKGEALYWSAPSIADMVKPSKPDNSNLAGLWQSTSKSSTSKYNQYKSRVSLQMISSSYANLASAKSKGQVQTVMASARRNIANLKMISSFGETDEQMKARACIASMQKLLHRGGRKIRRLNEGELNALRQKRAIRQNEKRKALQAKIEQERMKTKLKSADSSINKEGELEALNQAMRFRRYGNPYDDSTKSAYIPEAYMASAGSIPVMSDVATAGGSAITAAEISVSSISLEC